MTKQRRSSTIASAHRPNAKAIPGATVEYTITIENNVRRGATGLTVTDTIPTE